jgi:hypothetical protein
MGKGLRPQITDSPVNWKEYEKEIAAFFRDAYPDAKVTLDAKLQGRRSGKKRQFDLLIENTILDYSYKTVVEDRFKKRKIDVNAVEAFLNKMIDVGANKGIMISLNGYTDGAIARAHQADSDLSLDVLNFADLRDYQGHVAIPYRGPNGVVLDTPLGWIADARKVQVDPTLIPSEGAGPLCLLYERGQDAEDAWRKPEIIYVNFWRKTGEVSNLDALLEYQRNYLLEGNENGLISFVEPPKREDALTKIRLYQPNRESDIQEYTGFVDFKGFILMCVLLTPRALAEKNLSKLRYVIRRAFYLEVSSGANVVEE